MEDNIIGNFYEQNCGDVLLVLEKIKLKENARWLYRCQFQKYPNEIVTQKGHILNGKVYNNKIDDYNFIEKIFPQNCGDSLKVIRKIKAGYYEVEFINVPYKTKATKQHILEGSVDNSLFKIQIINKEFLQKNGYSIIVKEKVKEKYLCYFKEYPNLQILRKKEEIINGDVKDFEIEHYKLINSIWPQNCGDSLKILKYKQNNYYKCQFVNLPFEIIARLDRIKKGNVQNPKINSKSDYMKVFLQNFIKDNFKEKPTIGELCNKIEKSRTWISNLINKNDLRDLIKYYPNLKENELVNIIKSFYEGEILENDNILLNGKEIDIYLPDLKIGIEFNGNYWHCDKLKENSYHKDKSLFAASKGIRLIHIWEWEWSQKSDIIKQYLKDLICGPSNIIFARKCKMKELSNKEYQNFCNKYHLQGECGAKVKLGLFYNEELVQIMSFSIPRFTDKYEWEIIRECSKSGYGIIGGKEKLWKYFVKHYNPKNCISYCDYSKFKGDSYLKIGFKKIRLNEPGFLWLSRDFKSVYWRNPFKNNELKHLNKLYDCGQLVFEWKN